MWIFTTGGFVSAVEHRDDENKLMVRARDKKSLEEMLTGIELAGQAESDTEVLTLDSIYGETGSDYAWRVVVSKATFALWTQFEIMNQITYSNYKSETAKYRDKSWMNSLHRVWSAMFDQDESVPFAGGYGSHSYDSKRGIDYAKVFSPAKGKRGSEDYGYSDPATWDEPTEEDLAYLTEFGLDEGEEDGTTFDWLNGHWVTNEDETIVWTPYTDEEMAARSQYYEGEVFFEKNEEGVWVDKADL